ncbi:Predicted membrane protein [Kingella potus]|uniref:Predicted membrane protein n=1 Tax=Kingella potus TaxID=265175 RepID=A0A377R2N1_9NEIS|nr:DUF350 domain-containing protein [Kingella potus]UOP00200.1 DUF350 domain-containing protein [Kingella potus]STR02736.1 Predicted membrane protein [Kingella potus]
MTVSLSQYALYVQYMAAALLLLAAFCTIYLKTTPINELHLIKNGNLACALSFGGATAGFCLPLASSIAHSIGFADFVLWGAGAGVLQIAVYFAASRLIVRAADELAANNVAVGALFGIFSVSAGLLNAACLS